MASGKRVRNSRLHSVTRRKHTRSDHFARGNVDSQPPLIEVLNVNGTAGERGQQVNLGLVEQVVVLALESRVGLLLDLEDNITGEDTGHLVTLAAELDLVAVAHTLVDVDVQHLAFHHGLLPVALLAAVLVADDLTLTVAVRADGLEALDHGTHLAHHRLHTATIAARALLNRTLLASTAVTTRTDDRLLESQFGHLAAVDVLQVDLVHMVNGTGLLRAGVAHASAEHPAECATAAEELREQVLGVHTTGATAVLQALRTILIVHLTLLGIGQNLISVRQLLELLCGLGVVRVLVCLPDRVRDKFSVADGEVRMWGTYQGDT